MKFHPSSVCEQSPGQQSVSELFCGIGQFSYFFVSQTHYAMQMESNCGGGGMSKYGSLDVLHIFYVRPQTRVRHQQRAQWCVRAPCAPATHGGRDIHDRGRIRLKVISSFFCCCFCPAIIPSILARRTILAGCISPPATNAIIACPFLFLLCIIST
jgi:hypothetical protein